MALMKKHKEVSHFSHIQTSIDKAWKSWRDMPDGSHYQLLTHQLGIFVQIVVQDALVDGKAVFTSSIPHVGRVFIKVIASKGRRIITNHNYIKDFDEVVNDYLAWLCKKYVLKPDTQHVQSPAYIRMGIAMRAYTLERAQKNRKAQEIIKEEFELSEITKQNHFKYNQLKTLWFYPYGKEAIPDILPRSFHGISLRYLYVALRFNSGVSLSKIAAELDVHGSRLSALKKEYTCLFPGIDSRAWLTIHTDYKPILLKENMMVKMNLKGCHHRYSLIKRTDDLRVRFQILQNKEILWHLLILATDLATHGLSPLLKPFHYNVSGKNNMPDIQLTVKQDKNNIILMDILPINAKTGGKHCLNGYRQGEFANP